MQLEHRIETLEQDKIIRLVAQAAGWKFDPEHNWELYPYVHTSTEGGLIAYNRVPSSSYKESTYSEFLDKIGRPPPPPLQENVQLNPTTGPYSTGNDQLGK